MTTDYGSILYCPFCKVEIARIWLATDPGVTETVVAQHLIEKHPVRRRLSRRTRLAFKQHALNSRGSEADASA